MDFLEIAKRRYSCRSFKPDAVENDKLMKVLEAARIAPSNTFMSLSFSTASGLK